MNKQPNFPPVHVAIFLGIALLIAFSSPATGQNRTRRSSAKQKTKVRNVVLLIGDGMGHSQIGLGRLLAGKPETTLAFERMPVQGYLSTHSASHIVTDSAASGTALATGHKVPNQVISQTADGRPLRTLLEAAETKGLATGLVTTTRITHATPAAFAAHVAHRRQENDIATQLAASGAEVLLGGGARILSNKNLRAAFAKAGYGIVSNAAELASTKSDRILGLFSRSHMAYEHDRDPATEPSLAAMTKKALEVLSRSKKGFFLMIEGGRIDHGGHAHDAPAIAQDTVAFDEAFRVVEAFSRKNKETLVLVTADHATGGLAISETIDVEAMRKIPHSGEWMARKIKAGADLDATWAEGTGLAPLTDAEKQIIAAGKGSYSPSSELSHILSARVGIHFYPLAVQSGHHNTHGHDGFFVPYFAGGTGPEAMTGLRDQTDVPRQIARLLGLSLSPGQASSTNEKQSKVKNQGG